MQERKQEVKKEVSEVEQLKQALADATAQLKTTEEQLQQAKARKTRSRAYIKKLYTKQKDDSNSTSECHLSLNSDICECLERNKDTDIVKDFVSEITEDAIYIKYEKVREFKELCRNLIIDYFESD